MKNKIDDFFGGHRILQVPSFREYRGHNSRDPTFRFLFFTVKRKFFFTCKPRDKTTIIFIYVYLITTND